MSEPTTRPSPLRVLYVSPTASLGGAERSLLDILDGLNRSRFEPRVCLPGDGELKRELLKRSVPAHDLPLQRFKRTANPVRLLNYAATWNEGCRALVGLAREQHVALLHANGDTAQIFASLVAKSLEVPLVWHVRDLTPHPWIRRQLAGRATRIIAISGAVRTMLLEAGIDDSKIRVIYNGIETERFEGVSPPPEAPPTVGMIAHFYPWKGHRDFLNAAAIVSREIPESRFLIAGDDIFGDQPEYKEELRQMCSELGLAERVEFLGNCEDISTVLGRIHVLAVPSHGEPFGRCVVEAMAAARPVVSWNLAGPSEILEDGVTGQLASPFDVEAFAAAILSLLRDPSTSRAMGENGRAVAREKFHKSRLAAEIQALYEELCR